MGSVKGWICVVLVGILGYLYMESFDPESIANARVLVTGASTGIGEEIAYHYAKAGAQLVITARREQALQKVKAKCLELGAKNVSLIIADMGEPVDREQILEKAVTVLGGLDYLVLNHIGYTPFQMWEGDVSHARWLMEVCVQGRCKDFWLHRRRCILPHHSSLPQKCIFTGVS
ncbi:hydroxysteroid 11-beta-dehydrogenase 1 isoform X1 [Pelobates cultripes]|uniref:Hydroxysteroid 11-beta-dehydrogenase 1 isoform X1 n=1 Tax=Pelobates cultripes TaxID=61616 RepID=A0AAD1S802_PELCU|nr:hydroxysteroid 11-beta-dehydrogenase 1 isoform X1 [Pelobates cultripes]